MQTTSARGRCASEQPPQAALSESQSLPVYHEKTTVLTETAFVQGFLHIKD